MAVNVCGLPTTLVPLGEIVMYSSSKTLVATGPSSGSLSPVVRVIEPPPEIVRVVLALPVATPAVAR